MKQFPFILILMLFVSFETTAGTCYGHDHCNACTNCSECKHCNEGGGTCGVCSSLNNHDQKDEKVEPQKEGKTHFGWVLLIIFGMLGFSILVTKIFNG